MLSFAHQDFLALEQFGLTWRWTKPETALLPSEVLKRIRPLVPARAAELASRAVLLCHPRRDGMRQLPAGGNPEAVRRELAALPVAPHTRIVVSWSAEHAVLTDWETFYRHWDDFCYPSSDDVTVWPEAEASSLCYDHFEQFRFSDHDEAV